MLGENLVAEGHYLEAADLESFLFVAGKDGADEAFGNGVWLEENECGLSGHVRGVRREGPGWQDFTFSEGRGDFGGEAREEASKR